MNCRGLCLVNSLLLEVHLLSANISLLRGKHFTESLFLSPILLCWTLDVLAISQVLGFKLNLNNIVKVFSSLGDTVLDNLGYLHGIGSDGREVLVPISGDQ